MALRPVLAVPALCLALAAAPAAAPAPPRLVLVISVDQFSADLFQRWAKDMPGGLGRLAREGVVFTRAFHDHAFTETGPGHSVLLTGRTPGHTGIIENNWLDCQTGRKVYCVEDDSVQLVGDPSRGGASPSRLLGGGLGDWLQAQKPGSRLITLAGKDRAAVLMGGRKPTAAYWFDGPAGFTTSTAYAEKLPAWLERFDARLHERFRDESWTWAPLEPRNGQSRSGQWSVFGSFEVRNGALPRLVNAVGMPLDKGFYDRLRRTPFLDDLTFDAAEALIEGENLGRGKGTDVLALGLSATDYVGHAYGTQGQEMREQLLRLDRRLGAFLEKLKARFPDLRVVLCADHGGLDAPEPLKEEGFPAQRLEMGAWIAQLNTELRAKLKLSGDPILAGSEPKNLQFDPAVYGPADLSPDTLADAVEELLKGRPEVALVAKERELRTFRETDLGDPSANSIFARLKHSYCPGRSGNVMVAFKPFVIFTPASEQPAFAMHGAPYDYDRRVPLIFWGPWKPARRTEAVRTVDLAPTLARMLGVKPADDVDGKPLDLGAPGR